MTKVLYLESQKRALEYYEKANVILTQDEKENIEVADFGLNDLESVGLEIVTYVNTSRCCAKELVLFPFQTCPEHIHPPIEGEPGKEETFRCRYGKVYLYVEGDKPETIKARVPKTGGEFYTAFHEIILEAGMQYTLYPNTKHWFQAAGQGAVVSEFSTKSRDEADIFTNPNIGRIPVIE